MTSTITSREIEILQYISLGYTDKEIGEKIFLSPFTIKDHRKNIRKKLNSRNAAASVRKAMEYGLIHLSEMAQ